MATILLIFDVLVEMNFSPVVFCSGDPGVSEAWSLRPLPEDPVRKKEAHRNIHTHVQ